MFFFKKHQHAERIILDVLMASVLLIMIAVMETETA